MWGWKRSDGTFCEGLGWRMKRSREWMGVKEKMTRISCRIELRRRERKRSPLQAIEHFVKEVEGKRNNGSTRRKEGLFVTLLCRIGRMNCRRRVWFLKAGYKMNKYFAQSGDVRQGGMRGGRGWEKIWNLKEKDEEENKDGKKWWARMKMTDASALHTEGRDTCRESLKKTNSWVNASCGSWNKEDLDVRHEDWK